MSDNAWEVRTELSECHLVSRTALVGEVEKHKQSTRRSPPCKPGSEPFLCFQEEWCILW